MTSSERQESVRPPSTVPSALADAYGDGAQGPAPGAPEPEAKRAGPLKVPGLRLPTRVPEDPDYSSCFSNIALSNLHLPETLDVPSKLNNSPFGH